MKIFLGLTEIAGYYGRLKRGFELLGVGCTFIDLSGNRFDYDSGEAPTAVARFAQFVAGKREKTGRDRIFLKIFWKGLQFVMQLWLFLWALPQHDVFIFGAGSTFFFYYDLPILKWFGKTII